MPVLSALFASRSGLGRKRLLACFQCHLLTHLLPLRSREQEGRTSSSDRRLPPHQLEKVLMIRYDAHQSNFLQAHLSGQRSLLASGFLGNKMERNGPGLFAKAPVYTANPSVMRNILAPAFGVNRFFSTASSAQSPIAPVPTWYSAPVVKPQPSFTTRSGTASQPPSFSSTLPGAIPVFVRTSENVSPLTQKINESPFQPRSLSFKTFVSSDGLNKRADSSRLNVHATASVFTLKGPSIQEFHGSVFSARPKRSENMRMHSFASEHSPLTPSPLKQYFEQRQQVGGTLTLAGLWSRLVSKPFYEFLKKPSTQDHTDFPKQTAQPLNAARPSARPVLKSFHEFIKKASTEKRTDFLKHPSQTSHDDLLSEGTASTAASTNAPSEAYTAGRERSPLFSPSMSRALPRKIDYCAINAIEKSVGKFIKDLQHIKGIAAAGRGDHSKMIAYNHLYLDIKKTKVMLEQLRASSTFTFRELHEELNAVSAKVSEAATAELFRDLKVQARAMVPMPDRYDAFDYARTTSLQTGPLQAKAKLEDVQSLLNFTRSNLGVLPITERNELQNLLNQRVMARKGDVKLSELSLEEMNPAQRAACAKLISLQRALDPEVVAPGLFYHERQSGPYCQTCAVNNFLGQHLFSPEVAESLLFSLDPSRMGTTSPLIGVGNREAVHNLLSAKLTHTISQLGLDPGLLTESLQNLQVKTFRFGFKKGDLHAPSDPIPTKEAASDFAQELVSSKMDRCLLTFFYPDGGGHIVALRRSPSDPNRWLWLDGNREPIEINFKSLIEQFANAQMEFAIDCPRIQLPLDVATKFARYQEHAPDEKVEQALHLPRSPSKEEALSLQLNCLRNVMEKVASKESVKGMTDSSSAVLEKPSVEELTAICSLATQFNAPGDRSSQQILNGVLKNCQIACDNMVRHTDLGAQPQLTGGWQELSKSFEALLNGRDLQSVLKEQLIGSAEWWHNLQQPLKTAPTENIFEKIKTLTAERARESTTHATLNLDATVIQRSKEWLKKEVSARHENSALQDQKSLLTAQGSVANSNALKILEEKAALNRSNLREVEHEWATLAPQFAVMVQKIAASRRDITQKLNISLPKIDFSLKIQGMTARVEELLKRTPEQYRTEMFKTTTALAHQLIGHEYLKSLKKSLNTPPSARSGVEPVRDSEIEELALQLDEQMARTSFHHLSMLVQKGLPSELYEEFWAIKKEYLEARNIYRLKW